MLRQAGWRALAIPPDSCRSESSYISKLFSLFPHKTAATCAGLGWVGKNGLLIHRQYGPYLSWASILTDAPLTVNPKPVVQGYCGACHRCVEACPAGAISGKEWKVTKKNQVMIDVSKCYAQLMKNKKIYGKLACGLCVLACPRGR